jgi:Nickel responsive protein SCO4226-like
MPKFVIERDLAGAGKLPPQELKAISQKSCGVLHSMGPTIQWVQSYVTDDKIYCLYVAPDEETVRLHAPQGRLSGRHRGARAVRDRPDNGRMSRRAVQALPRARVDARRADAKILEAAFAITRTTPDWSGFLLVGA